MVDGERSEGVLKIADNIKAFAVMDMSINKASREQFMTRKASTISPQLMNSNTSAQLRQIFLESGSLMCFVLLFWYKDLPMWATKRILIDQLAVI